MNESAERHLRRGLRALVVDPTPAPPAAEAVWAGRALRRRRRVTMTLAGLAVLAVAAIPVLHRPAPPVRVAEPPAATTSSVVPESGGDGVQRGPKQATIGTPYPFDLYIHCGIRYADFTGAWWQADQVQPTYRPNKSDWRSQMYVLGTMTLIAPGEARFDAPAEGLHVTFRPLTAELEPCG